MLGLESEVIFTRTEAGWESSYVFDDIIEPLAECTFKRVMPKLKEVVPEHCISVREHNYHIWGDAVAYTITLIFDNEADEAEFIMKVSC